MASLLQCGQYGEMCRKQLRMKRKECCVDGATQIGCENDGRRACAAGARKCFAKCTAVGVTNETGAQRKSLLHAFQRERRVDKLV